MLFFFYVLHSVKFKNFPYGWDCRRIWTLHLSHLPSPLESLLYPGHFPSIKTTTLPSDIPSDKPIENPRINPLQDPNGFQVWFHIFKLVTSQPMLQVCTKEVYQVMGLFVFQSCILASILVYHYHKPHLRLPVPISVHFY